MPTVFTKIINGEIPSYKIAENENYYAFLDINPLMEGHTLVVPKQETDYIFDLDPDSLAGLTLFAQQVAGKIRKATGCNRVAVMVLGLEVPHAHIHLIPMNRESDIDFHKHKPKITPDRFEAIAEKIRQA
ncbi:MAG: HIT family protein [Rikenellaceae bacterium]|nr:HIT family protein [Rikenellaceae bacterium]